MVRTCGAPLQRAVSRTMSQIVPKAPMRPDPTCSPALERARRAARAGDDDGQRQADHQQLAELDAEIEREQRQQEPAAWQADLAQHRGESQAVHQPEAEHQKPAPSRRARDQVLEADVGDREGDRRFDPPGGEPSRAEDLGDERERVGDGEGADDRHGAAQGLPRRRRLRHGVSVWRCSRPDSGGQQQRHQKRQVVVAGQDVRDTEAEIEKGGPPERRGDAHVDCDLVRQIVKHDRRRRGIVLRGCISHQEPRVAGVVRVVIEEEVVAKVQRARVGPAGEVLDEDGHRLGPGRSRRQWGRFPLGAERAQPRRAEVRLPPGAGGRHPQSAAQDLLRAGSPIAEQAGEVDRSNPEAPAQIGAVGARSGVGDLAEGGGLLVGEGARAATDDQPERGRNRRRRAFHRRP